MVWKIVIFKIKGMMLKLKKIVESNLNQDVDDATKANFYKQAQTGKPYIEVDHALDNVSTLWAFMI